MDMTGPLKPANGRLVQLSSAHFIAFVDSSAWKLPPTYTVLESSSQNRLLTWPVIPVMLVSLVVLRFIEAIAVNSEPPRLVKFPPNINASFRTHNA